LLTGFCFWAKRGKIIEEKLTLGREATMNELRQKVKELEEKLEEKE